MLCKIQVLAEYESSSIFDNVAIGQVRKNDVIGT